jgi:hypothetical protein
VIYFDNKMETAVWIGNRLFSQEDLDLIIWTVEKYSDLSRTELAYTICENLDWKAPNGKERFHSCLDLLEKLVADGMLELPEKRKLAPYKKIDPRVVPLPQIQIKSSLKDIRPVTVEPVPSEEQTLWDATMATYHPFGFKRAFGAHQRYWIYGHVDGKKVVVGAFLFAAPARNVKVRDEWLGWTQQEQQRFRHRIVSNSRMLILPGVNVPYLASHALGKAARRLPEDWQARYGYSPVVLETFVTPPWRGTCYRAANWLHLGQTAGTGRQDRKYQDEATVREVFVYPLQRDWSQSLTAENVTQSQKLSKKEDAPMTRPEQLKSDKIDELIKQRYDMLAPFLDEKQRRLFAGAEAIAYGTGGLKSISAVLKMSPVTVSRGMKEVQNPETIESERIRQPGGGRKPATELDPELINDLEQLISPETRGDPQSPLRWTCKSTRKLAKELQAMKPGRSVSSNLVSKLLRDMGYSLQGNRKTLEGASHPDRDAQFKHINDTVNQYQHRSQPVISVDTKKKELVGDFKNAGVEWQPKGEPEKVQVHDFMLRELGKASPYGVYDRTRNEGWVNVGTDHDTAEFAVASIRGWWQQMGRYAYPNATELLITADGGGSNGSRSRLWKVELQHLADETGLCISVCHYPPGTSKWNAIEHRMFSHITQNWRGRPLISHETIVNLIANTTTAGGLTIQCQLDTQEYPKGIKISNEELASVHIERSEFHGEWNYTILPQK